MKRAAAALLVGLLLASCGRTPAVTLYPAEAPPDRLSDWGVVLADGGFLEFDADAIPYALNAPLYSDYALKLRTIRVPDGGEIDYRDTGTLGFPVGTIITKTFHYRKADGFSAANYRVLPFDGDAALGDGDRLSLEDHVLIETRLLVHYEDGWRALPYVWNAAQDEAFLEIAGDVREIELIGGATDTTFVYVVPDQNQCAGCHVADMSSKALMPLGPKVWQLHRAFDVEAGGGDQLRRWAEHGLLAGLPDSPPAAPHWDDESAPLEIRAKAYLDANCAHCHNERGPADTSALDLSFDAPVDRRYGICKPPVAVGRGSGNRPYDIVPGNPDASILVYRMEETDPAIAMPELGRSTVHREGVALVRDWIASLEGDC